MKVDARGVQLIKRFEGLRLKAYLCPAKIPTIGYGTTQGIRLGMEITEPEAEALLRRDLEKFERGVSRLIEGSFTSQSQFNAMVSLAYNIGLGAFQRSSVLRYHRQGQKIRAGASFLLWVKAAGRKLPGLVRRRAAERAMYLS